MTVLHLRPDFESIIHLPEEVTSVVLGNPSLFKAEHNEGEPDYVYVKPVTKGSAQSNLLIATVSGQHVSLELVSDAGESGTEKPVDFLLEYRTPRSFLVGGDAVPTIVDKIAKSPLRSNGLNLSDALEPLSALDLEYEQQARVNTPDWTKWRGQEVETSIGDIRQWGNRTVVAFSVFNASAKPVEMMAPQIQITGAREKKRKKRGEKITSDQLEVREYRLSKTRLEPGGRVDAALVFDRPSFKQASERLFLQIAQADQVDRPILISLPFTPPIAGAGR